MQLLRFYSLLFFRLLLLGSCVFRFTCALIPIPYRYPVPFLIFLDLLDLIFPNDAIFTWYDLDQLSVHVLSIYVCDAQNPKLSFQHLMFSLPFIPLIDLLVEYILLVCIYCTINVNASIS